MLQAFKDIVPDISAIGMHSLRSGGATAALNVMATGLMIWIRTGMFKILYLHVCRFLRL